MPKNVLIWLKSDLEKSLQELADCHTDGDLEQMIMRILRRSAFPWIFLEAEEERDDD